MNSSPPDARRSALSNLVDFFLPILVALPVLWILAPGGLPSTADGQVHFIRSAEMVNAWRQGIFFPSWSENLGFGLGIPLFLYAPPLPYLITAALHWAGLSLEAAFKGVWLIALLISAFGGYRLARDPLGCWPAVVSCAALVYAPLHLRELFIQGNIGQYLAWAFLPWVCWGVIQIFRTGGVGYVVVVALAICGVQLSHHAVALLGAGMAGGLWLFLTIGVRQARPALLALGGVLFGLALSVWFWVPALLSLAWIRTDAIAASDFHGRFLPFTELIALSPRLDKGAINPYFPMTLGAVQVLLGLGGVVVSGMFVYHARPGARVAVHPTRFTLSSALVAASLFFTCAFLFGAFMALSWSAPLWDALPFLNLFEFPWRWHGLTNVALAWLAGLFVYGMGCWRPRLETVIGAIALVALLTSALVNLYPDKLPQGVYRTSPRDVVRYEQRTGQVGTTSLGEFTPRWVEHTLTTSALVKEYERGGVINRLPDSLPDGVIGEPLSSGVERHDFRISVQQPTTLTIDLHYFPGWRAVGDDRPLTTAPHPMSGLLDVRLPEDIQTLTLRLEPTPLQSSARVVSAAAWLSLMALAGWGLFRHRARMGDTRWEEDRGRSASVFFLALIAIALLMALRIWGRAWFTFASPPDQAVTAVLPLQADFGDQLRVLGVDPPAPLIRRGETLATTVYLRSLQPLDTNYTIFLHLDRPDGVTVASAQVLHPGDIPTSKWATGLHVRSPLRLTAPADLPPIRYRLRIGVVEPKSGEWLSLADGSGDVLEIGKVWVEGDAVQPPAGPRARFGDAIQLLDVRVDRGNVRFYWQADGPVSESVTVFVHLLDSQGKLVAQLDGAPFAGQYPPALWRPSQVIEDVRPMPLLDNIVELAVGLYDLQSGERLHAVDDTGAPLANDAFVASTIR